VIIFTPHWYSYPVQVGLAGGNAVLVPTREEERFQPDMEAVRGAVTGATKAIVINSPCNPTGAVYRREMLAELAELAVERDLLVIADEVYEKILFDGAEHVSIGSLNEEIGARTVTVGSVSKTHSMAGWRIGYAAVPGELVEAVTFLQAHSTSGPCAISQRAALTALAEESSHVGTMVAEYGRRRGYLLERLAGLEGVSCVPPEGTFYLFVNVSGLYGREIGGRRIGGSVDFAEALREGAGTKVIAGAEFGSDRHVRMSFAASMETLTEGMDRIERFLAS
jgi:aspartate aminotransferase